MPGDIRATDALSVLIKQPMERNLLVIIKDYFLSEHDRYMSTESQQEARYMHGYEGSRLMDGSSLDMEEVSFIDREAGINENRERK